MALLSRVLVPVEFSPRCLGSAQYAEALACRFHCDLTLLHIRVPPAFPAYAPDVMAYSSAFEDDEKEKLRLQTQIDAFPLKAPAGCKVSREVLEGDPAASIVQYAHEGGFDLIVMPTHGYGPFRRFLLGSVTAKVLHDAQCPVWTGPHMESAAAPEGIGFHDVLCAIDLEAGSEAVLQWAADFAGAYGAKLHVVHVIAADTAGGFRFDQDWHLDVMEQSRRRIDGMQLDLHTHGEVGIETGEVPAAIRSAAERLQAGLVVIGRGRRAGLLAGLRRNAYAILRESPCPVAAI